MAYDLKQLFCPQPFRNLLISGNKYRLCCPAWGGLNIAPITASPDEAWNGQRAQELRESVLDGSFRFCQKCPALEDHVARASSGQETAGFKKLVMRDSFMRDVIESHSVVVNHVPDRIVLGQSVTCNLKCPSCRSRIMRSTKEPQADIATARHFLFNSDLPGHVGVIRAAGAGEVFANPHYREFLSSLRREDHPKLRLSLATNGTLLKRYLPTIIEHGPPVTEITISVDAATKDTYEAVRLGSSWSNIMANLRYIASTGIRVHLVMVVQRANWREMGMLLELAKGLGFAEVHYSAIHRNARSVTANARTLIENAIHLPSHPKHAEFVESLYRFYDRYKEHIELRKRPYVTLSNLASLTRGQVPPWLETCESLSGPTDGQPKSHT